MRDPLTTYPSFLPETLSDPLRVTYEQQAQDPNFPLEELLAAPAGVFPELVLANPALLLGAVTEPGAFTRPAPDSDTLSGLHALASHPKTPPELLRLLITSTSGRVVAAAINNPSVTPELLEYALTNLNVSTKGRPNRHVPDYVRIHDELYRRLPLERAIELAMSNLDAPDEPLRPLLTHPDLGFEEAQALYEQARARGAARDELGNRARAALLLHPDAPADLLAEAQTLGTTTELIALAEAPAAPAEILTKLTWYLVETDGNYEARYGTPKRTGEHLSPWCKTALEHLASRPDLPAEAAHLLCSGAHVDARKRLADNPITPPSVLEKLLGDAHPDVRYRAARHPNMHWHEDPPRDMPGLIAGRAQHPHLTPDQRLDLVKRLEGPWLETLARDPNTPPEVHASLLKHRLVQVEAAAVANPNTSTEELVRVASSPFTSIQVSVARHARTPEDILLKLADATMEAVKRAAILAYQHNRINGRTPTRP